MLSAIWQARSTERNAACCSCEQQNGKVSSLVAIGCWCESHQDEAVKEIAAVAEGQQSRPQMNRFNWDGEMRQWSSMEERGDAESTRRRLSWWEDASGEDAALTGWLP